MMTPTYAWKMAEELEKAAENLKGLALVARQKHMLLERAELHEPGLLFPVTLDSVADDIKRVSYCMS